MCNRRRSRPEQSGYFYAPTLLAGVDQASPAVTEEIFGPVLTLQTFETEEEALLLAATHPTYGLRGRTFHPRPFPRGSRHTRVSRPEPFGQPLRTFRDARILPTGGYKSSGIGKDLAGTPISPIAAASPC